MARMRRWAQRATIGVIWVAFLAGVANQICVLAGIIG